MAGKGRDFYHCKSLGFSLPSHESLEFNYMIIFVCDGKERRDFYYCNNISLFLSPARNQLTYQSF